jgi:hypothetical protein
MLSAAGGAAEHGLPLEVIDERLPPVAELGASKGR